MNFSKKTIYSILKSILVYPDEEPRSLIFLLAAPLVLAWSGDNLTQIIYARCQLTSTEVGKFLAGLFLVTSEKYIKKLV